MRRTFVCLVALSLVAASASTALAQTERSRRQNEETETKARDDARKQLDREMQNRELPVPELANSGPCPYVKVLYDASRTIDFVGEQKSSATVAYSGEIEGLVATCRYKQNEPITVDTRITFALGKGPQATSNQKTYGYWVAVTDRNRAVLAKEHFAFDATWPAGADRVLVYEHIGNIVIPRANQTVSGQNFEVLVGFDVTAEQAAFNRNGARFVVNATGQQAQAASAGTE
jgi:hypothetical protein